MAIGQGNEGIFAVIEGIIAGVGEKLGAMGRAIGDAVGTPGEGGSLGGGGGFLSSIKDFASGLTGGAERSPEIAPMKQPELVIQAPTQSVDRFHVDISDLGQFTAQNFTGQSMNTGKGAGMGGVA